MKQIDRRFNIQENVLFIANDKIVFDFPIKAFIEIEDMLIVYLDLFDKVISLEENVFGISLSERKIKWQIEKRKYPSRGNGKMLCPFVGISYNEGKLRLHNWCSITLVVDSVTGKVLETEEAR